MKPNIILNLLWKIPTKFWDFVYRRTGYMFAAIVDRETKAPLLYFFQKDAPAEFTNWPKPK